jgi:ParB-like chromosome segregation protein Spo0J
MAVSTHISFEEIDNLYLDPLNPRLGRHRIAADNSQEKLLEWMSEWKVDELAASYIESGGFWAHEPLIVVKERLYKKDGALVVVEGNRRLAALKLLRNARDGSPLSRKWSSLVDNAKLPNDLFARVPFVQAETREDVQAFLGFRHVTGIKQWDADEKAGFITKLIDENRMNYEQVARKIGSTAPAVRRHYVAYQLLLQIEAVVDHFPLEKAEHRFTVLYDTLQKQGTQAYLSIDSNAEPEKAKNQVKKERYSQLAFFSRWVYGTERTPPLITDTRSGFKTCLD